ncbi:hypothetical protein [Vitiosangium sp. GDMCC 1.1324]|uniref:hypothetical protein n=1 Tax=Vitiosangium sp. (strain GDMCC 1.1324) TaxID=2138576 RepID=UPI000D3BDDEB|nr:hypothetical protein [Vitiosangium sp. GDMCC 1.1324]PTL84476.1 hypothetical protein DAT35_05140 [Vitiosangium sp. GDMCC 1.1324]
MSLLSIALVLSLAQTPTSCKGERVVLVPFQPVALSTTEARELEDAVRRVAESTSGMCLEPRAETVTKVRAQGGRLVGCVDAACRGAQVLALGVDRVVRGVALGVGGGRSVALTLVDRAGLESHTLVQLSGEGLPSGLEEARAREAFSTLWSSRLSSHKVERPSRALPTVMLAAGGVALAAGVGFGLAARRSETRLAGGTAGCTGEGEAFRSCFEGRIQEGRKQARTANVLMGAGALLGLGGAVFFIWELP